MNVSQIRTVSQILAEDHSISIQPGKKGACPQCHQNHFSIKADDSIGKCFYPPCGFLVTPHRDTGDYRSSLTRVLDAVYADFHQELLVLATRRTADPKNAYVYLHDERGIHPTVIADAPLGAVPAGYNVTPHFQAAITDAEQAVQALGAAKRGRPSRQFLHAEQRVQDLKDAQQKLVECLAHKAGWVVFFYTDAAHRLVALRLRQPYSKHFASFKPGVAGLFGRELFTPYVNQANQALNGYLIIVEGECNLLQLQSLTIRYEEATGQPLGYVNASAAGGVLGADVETIRRVASHPVVVHDNDANQAGFALVRRVQQVMPVEACTTPRTWGDKSDLDSYIRDFDQDHAAAWVGVQALIAARQPYGRMYSGTGEEFFAPPVTGGKDVFVPKLLAEALMAHQHYRYAHPALLVYKNGVYTPNEGTIETDCLTLLGNEWKEKRRDETIAYVQDAKRIQDDQAEKPCYLNLQNGLYNLETKTLDLHTPEHFSVVQLPYEFKEGARCPAVLQWFEETTGGDDTVIQVLRAYLKAIVQGATNIQRILEVVGPGGSGKGTYIRLAMALVGLANTRATDLKHLETSRFEMATVRWKRLVVITDAERYGGPISNLKALTGGDLLRMEEKMIQGRQDRTADGLVLIAANEEVQSSDYTSGLGRRRLTIYFLHTPDVPRKLLHLEGQSFVGDFVEELPGVLNWVLEMPDDDMKDLLSLQHQYRTPSLRANWIQTLLATNPLAEWAHGHLILDPMAETKVGMLDKIDITTTTHDRLADKSESVRVTHYNNEASWLYPNYVGHMQEVGAKPIALKRFTAALHDFLTQQLKAKHVTQRVGKHGSHFYGVRLRTAQDDAQDTSLLLDDDAVAPF